jgi:hypothetical protein
VLRLLGSEANAMSLARISLISFMICVKGATRYYSITFLEPRHTFPNFNNFSGYIFTQNRGILFEK